MRRLNLYLVMLFYNLLHGFVDTDPGSLCDTVNSDVICSCDHSLRSVKQYSSIAEFAVWTIHLCVAMWMLGTVYHRTKVYLIGAPNRLLQCLLGTIWNPQTPLQVEHVLQDHSRHGWTPSGVPSSSAAPAGSSRSFPAIPASSAICRCL